MCWRTEIQPLAIEKEFWGNAEGRRTQIHIEVQLRDLVPDDEEFLGNSLVP